MLGSARSDFFHPRFMESAVTVDDVGSCGVENHHDSWSQLRPGLMLGSGESGFILDSWSLLCQEMMLGDVESGFTMIHIDS
jgi:hypothetical protein